MTELLTTNRAVLSLEFARQATRGARDERDLVKRYPWESAVAARERLQHRHYVVPSITGQVEIKVPA